MNTKKVNPGVDTFQIRDLANDIRRQIEALAQKESKPEFQELTRQMVLQDVCAAMISKDTAGHLFLQAGKLSAVAA